MPPTGLGIGKITRTDQAIATVRDETRICRESRPFRPVCLCQTTDLEHVLMELDRLRVENEALRLRITNGSPMTKIRDTV